MVAGLKGKKYGIVSERSDLSWHNYLKEEILCCRNF